MCLAPAIAGAQEAERDVSPPAVALEKFRLSGPPALSLLGVSAASVARPNTPRDLIASLVSGAGANGIVPDGYSIETAPYWLIRHRALGLDEYHRASFGDRLKYFTAISVATSRPRTTRDSTDGAHAAIAIRTLLANGRPSRRTRAIGDSIRAGQIQYIELYRRWETARSHATGLEQRRRRLTQQDELLSSLLTRVIVVPAVSLRDSTVRTLARRDSLRALVATGQSAADAASGLGEDLDRIEVRLGALAKRYASEEIEPDGLVLELATGIRALFVDSQWGRQRADGIGIWATPMYREGTRGIEIVGVVRYLSQVREYGHRNLLDLGARAGVDIGRGSLSAEHVWRSLNGQGMAGFTAEPSVEQRDRTTRWAVLFDYPVGGKLWAVASFGSDYRRDDGDRPVIATVGLNLGFGAIEILPTAR